MHLLTTSLIRLSML